MTALLLIRVLVVGLATYRIARAIALDAITEPARAWLYWTAHGDPQGHVEPEVTNRALAKLYELLACPFCCGFWIALALYLAWQGWSVDNLLAAIAAAGVAAFLAAVDRAAMRGDDD